MERKRENETARAEDSQRLEASDTSIEPEDEEDDEFQPDDEAQKTKRRKPVNKSDEAIHGELPRG